jgi:hypothetical protein
MSLGARRHARESALAGSLLSTTVGAIRRFSRVLGMLSSLGGASPPPNLMEVKG